MLKPVVVIGADTEGASSLYDHGIRPIFVDFEQIRAAGDGDMWPAETISNVLDLEIDTIFKIDIIEQIFTALGDDDQCIVQFNAALEYLELPLPLARRSGLNVWPGWMTLAQNKLKERAR